MGNWTIEFAGDTEEWLLGLTDDDFDAIRPSIDELEERGPALGRPYVDGVRRSRHSNMKELRSFGGNLRVLFAFDRRRQAVLLIGGDKTNDWDGWYERNIPVADQLLDRYI